MTNALAINFDVESFGCPVGNAQFQHKGLLGFGEGEGAAFCGPFAILLYGYLLGIPTSRRRQIESHPQRVAAREVSCFLVFHMILHSSATAAGRLWCLVAPRLRGIQSHCVLIEYGIVVVVQRADELVVENSLVVVHVAGIIWLETVEVLRQLRQIIGAACLVQCGLRIGGAVAPVSTYVCTHREDLGVGLAKHLAVAHASHRIAVASLYHRPEVLGEVVIVWISVAAISSQGSCHHRYMLVGMTCADGIHVLRQRCEERRTVKICSGLQQVRAFIFITYHF